MTFLKGSARAAALDDMAQLAFDGFVSAMPAEVMAKELSIKYGHLLDEATFCTAIRIAQHRYFAQFQKQPPQVDPDPMRQAPELKLAWPPESASML